MIDNGIYITKTKPSGIKYKLFKATCNNCNTDRGYKQIDGTGLCHRCSGIIVGKKISGSNHYLWKGGIKNPKKCLDCNNLTCDGHSERCKKCFHLTLFGKGNPNYKGNNGVTKLSKHIRALKWYKDWVKAIFERDNYTCQYTQKRGGNLHAHHHIKEFHEILLEESLINRSRIEIIEAVRLRHIDISAGITVDSNYHIRIIHNSNGHVLKEGKLHGIS